MGVADDRALVDHYLTMLQVERKLAAHTVENYRRDLAELLEALPTFPGTPALAKLTPVHIRKCVVQWHGKGLAPRSIARKLSAWRGFFAWLAEQQPMAQNPVASVKAPKAAKPLPKALSPDDAVRLVDTPGAAAQATRNACNRAMFELLYSSGLRVSELTSLDVAPVREGGYTSPGWIDFAEGSVTVTGKGSKMRSVPVGTAAMQAVKDWLVLRAPLVRNDPHALFLTERGARMTPRTVQARIKAHAIAVGIPADVHPHMLRHSFASHVLQSSGDLRAVQEMLGHASIASTQIYTALDFQHLAKIYDAAHPRAKKK